MSAATNVGAAVAAGYLLGRFKKLRLALIVASALGNSAVRARGLELLKDGAQSLNSSPDVQKLGHQVSGQLVQAGKAAAVAAAAGRIDKLSDRLHERSSAWTESPTSTKKKGKDSDEAPEDQEPEDEVDETEPDEEPEGEYDEAEDAQVAEEPEEPEDEQAEDEEPEDEWEDEEDVDQEEDESPRAEQDEQDENEQDEEDEPAKPQRRTRSPRRRRSGAPTGGA